MSLEIGYPVLIGIIGAAAVVGGLIGRTLRRRVPQPPAQPPAQQSPTPQSPTPPVSAADLRQQLHERRMTKLRNEYQRIFQELEVVELTNDLEKAKAELKEQQSQKTPSSP